MSLILQLDAHGQPNKWATWKVAVIFHSKGQVIWSAGEHERIIRGGVNRDTHRQSIIKTSSIIAIKGEPGRSKKAWTQPTLSNRHLFRRDKYCCAYCGKIYADTGLSRDHIIPVSRGGQDSWQNCVTACLRCNNKKSHNMLEECGMRLLYVPYVPSRAEFLILSNRNILACQMEFLLSFIDSSKPTRIV